MLIPSRRSIQLAVGFIICVVFIIVSINLSINAMQQPMPLTYSYLRDFTFMKPANKGTRSSEQLDLLTGGKPWFMRDGIRLPTAVQVDSTTGRRDAKLWPDEDPQSDRIINQFMFVPPHTGKPLPMKKVLMWHGLIPWETIHPKGSPEPFKTCPVSNCEAVTNHEEALEADAILFLEHFGDGGPKIHKPSHQVWIMFTMESPFNTEYIYREDAFNWTATYMQSSDIVRPYGKWVYFNQSQTEWQGPARNFAAGKTKKVAWLLTNCNRQHNSRRYYATHLSQFIEVDIYGGCGIRCSQSTKHDGTCFTTLKNDYKFYLAFENSNCREYITEKFFENSLRHNVIPIVMGAPKEDYERVAPKGSFIHVEDFDSPEDLAAYLHKIDNDDDLFNSYFKWKGMGEVLETYFYCRLCAMLNDDFPPKYYRRFNDFWRKPGSCISGFWRDYRRSVGGELPSVSPTIEN